MTTELSKSEFNTKITEIAKDAIKKYCVMDNNDVEYQSYASIEITSELDFVSKYPFSIEEYGSGKFRIDDAERLGSLSPKEAIEFSRQRIFEQTVDKRIKELIDGEWDAIKKTKETREVIEEKTKFEE